MKSHLPTSSWASVAAFIVAVGLAFAGNVFGLTLFFGVEFIFGSIATLITIAALGRGAGIATAIIAGSYTFFAWNHPFAWLSLVAESIFVAATLNQFRGNLALAAGAFWIVLGLPLVWLSYRFGLGMDQNGATLIAIKQSANGILNAIAASLVLSYSPIMRWLNPSRPRVITVFQHTFNVFVGLALVPTIVVVLLDARRTVGQFEREINASVETLSTGLSLSINRWRAQNIKAVEQLAIMAEDFGIEDRGRLQKFVEESNSVWTDFVGIFFTDKKGTTIAFDPLTNMKGESTIGLNFADRPYFQILRDGQEKVNLSKVFMARGGVFQPVVNVASRVELNGEFAGIVAASLDLTDLKKVFDDIKAASPFRATLIEPDGTVIVSSDSDLEPLDKFESSRIEAIGSSFEGRFRHLPRNLNQPPMEVWKNSRLGKSVVIPGTGSWRLIVEIPVAPLQSGIYARYIEILAFLIVLVLVIVAGSLWIASMIATPLKRLSSETTNLPERLRSSDSITFPRGAFSEIRALSENFEVMIDALKKRFRDLDESRRELDKANKAKDEFLATLSHELRTPLNAILGHAELLKSEMREGEHLDSVTAIHRNAVAQNQIIADLLDVSAIVAGKIAFNAEHVPVDEIVSAAVAGVRKSAEEKGLVLEETGQPSRAVVIADRTRMQQVFWNLLANAVKFTPRGGKISIDSTIDSSGWSVRISDTGQGIEAEYLDLIFERFRQEDSSITRRFGGLGLGLSIARQIVEYHAGSIRAESPGKGRGSVFTVFIPASRLAPAIELEPARQDVPREPQSDLGGAKVLLVDDDADARALAKRFLVRSGANVETAESVETGLETFKRFAPDIVISDIGMPGENGYSFLRRLRELPGGDEVPVAALTAFAMEFDRIAIFEAGFQAHVTKPVSKAELVRVVADLLK